MAPDRSGRFGPFGPYLPIAARVASGRKEAELRAGRAGRPVAPVAVDERAGRDVAWTFWGKAWARHLERYGDIANRLPRGRTLVRNGSVVDLVIRAGRVDALVCGSALYEVEVTIDPAHPAQWKALVAACAGRIDSVVELLAGRVASGLMTVLTEPARGLFPAPEQIHFTCSCPDAARLCKHIAAVLYGIAGRLDAQPELLFVLRAVDPNDLTEIAVDQGEAVLRGAVRPRGRVLAPEAVAELFGVEWDAAPLPETPSLAEETKTAAPRAGEAAGSRRKGRTGAGQRRARR